MAKQSGNQPTTSPDTKAAEDAAATKTAEEGKAGTIIIVNQCNNQFVDPDTNTVFRPGQQTPFKGKIKEGSWLDCQIKAKLLAVVE